MRSFNEDRDEPLGPIRRGTSLPAEELSTAQADPETTPEPSSDHTTTHLGTVKQELLPGTNSNIANHQYLLPGLRTRGVFYPRPYTHL